MEKTVKTRSTVKMEREDEPHLVQDHLCPVLKIDINFIGDPEKVSLLGVGSCQQGIFWGLWKKHAVEIDHLLISHVDQVEFIQLKVVGEIGCSPASRI